jgi:UDP-glucose 4-epimerase
MERILLTGASGFIGSHLVPALLSAGHQVSALVRQKSKCPSGCVPLAADLKAPETLRLLSQDMAEYGVLIHLAAKMPQQSIASETVSAMCTENLETTRHLLDALPCTVSHIIFAGTIDVYGPPQFLPLTEAHPANPVTSYGISKLETERLLDAYCRDNGLTLTVLRFSQVYGPGEPAIKAIPLFIKAVKAGEPPVIYGDGSELRDYVYVDDARRACVAAVNRKPTGVFNIASGKKVSIKEVLERIISISGKELAPVFQERQKEKMDIYFDVSKPRTELGFTPHVSLEKGLKKHYDFYTQTHA